MNNSKSQQVINYINTKIENRFFIEGQIIDSENTISQKLNISRMTVRKAIDELVSKGVLYREKGRGTFVSIKPKYAEFSSGFGFTKEATKRGFKPSTIDATIRIVNSDSENSEILRIPISTKLWEVTRVRCTNEIPTLYAEEYFIYSQTQDLDLDVVEHSIFDYIEDIGIVPSYSDQKIEASLCDEMLSEKLRIEKGTPLIKATIITYGHNGMPFTCSTEFYRTDRYKLVQTIFFNK